MQFTQVILSLLIFAALCVAIRRLTDVKETTEMAVTINPDVNGKVDLSQVRALEAALVAELGAAASREAARDQAFKTIIGGYADQLTALQQKYTDAINAAANTVPDDLANDYNSLLGALNTAKALGIGSVTDFLNAPAPVVADQTPGDQPTPDPAATDTTPTPDPVVIPSSATVTTNDDGHTVVTFPHGTVVTTPQDQGGNASNSAAGTQGTPQDAAPNDQASEAITP